MANVIVGAYIILKKKENLIFTCDNEYDIHMTIENYKKVDYGHDLDLW